MLKKTLFIMLVVVFCACAVFAQSVEEKTTERIGIISAMENEINLLLMNTDVERVDHIGGLDFIIGRLSGKDVVIVRAGIGKVYASAGTTALINNYNISEIVFTGIAGGVGDQTNVLDVVVASDLVQHDYGTITDDGFYWRDEYNLEDKGRIYCDQNLVEQSYRAACAIIGADNVFIGTIVTGDQFIASSWYVTYLQDTFNAIACEMEGASVGAVCDLYSIPFVVIRTMSDKADGLAHETYENMADRAADNSSRIVMELLKEMK